MAVSLRGDFKKKNPFLFYFFLFKGSDARRLNLVFSLKIRLWQKNNVALKKIIAV